MKAVWIIVAVSLYALAMVIWLKSLTANTMISSDSEVIKRSLVIEKTRKNTIKEIDLNPNRRRKVSFLLEPFKVVNKACQTTSCFRKKDPRHTMAVFVKSTLSHSYNRELIRSTWGSFSVVKQFYIDTVFVVGKGEPNSPHSRQLYDEHLQYGDILQMDGPDDYVNIPFKTLAGMQWAVDNLPDDYLYSSADDDMMVDLLNLVQSIDESFEKSEENNWPEFPIICGFVKGLEERPVRDYDSVYGKWAIKKHVFKWHVFPPYCHGGLYTTTVAVAGQLYNLSRDVELLRLDDVWITGILRRKLEMPDDMVLAYPQNNRFHFTNFSKNVTRNSVLFVERWTKLYKEMKEQRFAFCECHKGDVDIRLC